MTGSVHAFHFDLDGTLVELTVSFERIVADAAEAVGVDDPAPAAFGEALGNLLHDDCDPIMTAAEHAFPAVDPAAFRDRFIEAEVTATTPLPGAKIVLRTLHRYHPVGIISNGIGRLQRKKLEATGLADYVDDVVVSGEIGVGKPDLEIYRVAAARLPADRRTFVADDYERDLKPAAGLGWETVSVGDGNEDGRTISSLRALLE